MKRTYLVAVALMFALSLSAQTTSNEIQNYIEVTGCSEISITPDIFYVSITIDESDSKGRMSAKEQERKMISELKKADIDTSKQLKLNTLSSTFTKRKEAYSAVEYTLTLNSEQSLVDAFEIFDKLYISKVNLVRTESSQLKKSKAKARRAAIKDAKGAAMELAESLDQEIGKCFYIYDMSNDDTATNYTPRLYAARSTDAAMGVAESSPLEIKDIKLSYRVRAKFILN